MENKRKNIYIVIFVITTIVASCVALYFGIIKNKETEDLKAQVEDLKDEINSAKSTNDEYQDNKENANNVIKNESKELLVNDETKKEHNKILANNDNVAILQIIIANKQNYNISNDTYNFENGNFNDSDMLSISAFVSSKINNSDFQKNSRDYKEEGPVKYVKKEFLNNYSKKIFDKEINFSNTGAEVVNDEVAVGFPTGLGIYIYKAKSLILNEKTNEYTLTFDSVYPPDESIDRIDEYKDENKINYEQSAIYDTYVLKYKKVNGNNVIISLDRTYHK